MSNLSYSCAVVTDSCNWVKLFVVALQRLFALLHVFLSSNCIMFNVADLMSYCNVAECIHVEQLVIIVALSSRTVVIGFVSFTLLLCNARLRCYMYFYFSCVEF